MKDFFCALGITLISWFTCLVTVLILAVFVSLIGQSLSWYNHFYVSVCLYGTAAVAKIILIHTLAKKFYYVVSVRPVYGFLFAASEDGRQIPVGFVVGFLSQQTLFGTMIENWLQNRVNFLEGIFRGFGGLPCAAELSVFGCSSLPLQNLLHEVTCYRGDPLSPVLGQLWHVAWTHGRHLLPFEPHIDFSLQFPSLSPCVVDVDSDSMQLWQGGGRHSAGGTWGKGEKAPE